MNSTQATLPRLFKSCKNIPEEIISRLNQVREHTSLREQRNTFSLPQIHGRTPCRWNSHLLKLPYFHIIEPDEVDPKVHILLFKHRKILSLQKERGTWQFFKLTPEDYVNQIVPNRNLRTGHLYKTSSQSKMKSVEVSLGMKSNQIPVLTEANANIILQCIHIRSDLTKLRSLADQYTTELDLKINHKKAI